MQTNEIETAIVSFREQRTVAMHARINALGRRQQTKAFIARELQALDEAVAAYRASLGAPDDTPGEQQDEPVPAIKPGMKSE